MSTPAPDRTTIERLVAEVLRRLAAEARPALAPSAAAHAVAPPTSAGVTLADRVITLAALERLPAGTRSVVLQASAVVTPSARDYARDTGIVLDRGAGPAAQPAATRPFLVATAACAADPASKAAAIARAVPGAQRLPASGLADVITALATQASRDAARGILLTSRPAVAAILANRSASLRAVTGRDAATLAAAATDCQANLTVVDPASFAGGLDRLCADFATRASGPLPAEL
ncbi:MAG: hypothetical protein ACKONH_03430, partial [Planctomycetia bacterium]